MAGHRTEKHRRPTAEEREERVRIDLPPDIAIGAILATGPHPEEDEEPEDEEASTSS